MGQLKVWNPVTAAYEPVTAAGVTVRDASGAQEEANAGELIFGDGTVFPQGDGSVRVIEPPTGVIGAKAYHSTTQVIGAGVTATLALDSEAFDTDGFHNPASNNERVTVPAGLAGKYLLMARLHTTSDIASNPQVAVWFRLNATSRLRGASGGASVAGTQDLQAGEVEFSTVVDLVGGDYVDVQLFSLGGVTVGHANVELQTTVTIIRLGSGNVSGLGTARAVRTSGDLTLNSLTWANVDTGIDLVVPAQVGDVLLPLLSAVWGTQTVGVYVDAATIVGGSPVNYISGGAGGAGHQGVIAWRSGAGGDNLSVGGGIQYVVQSGDISGGNVTLRLRYRTSSASDKTLFAQANVPLHWSVVNLRGGAASRDIGYEFAYAEYTAGSVALTATTEGTSHTVVATSSVVYDGATRVMVEFFASRVTAPGGAGDVLLLLLYEDSTLLGRIATILTSTASAWQGPVQASLRRLPAAGSHTYTVKGYVSAGTGYVYGGAGGAAAQVPAYIRVIKA